MIDSSTKKPISIRNDNGMEDIGVYAFDKEEGVQLWVDTVKNLTSTGVVDGVSGSDCSLFVQSDLFPSKVLRR